MKLLKGIAWDHPRGFDPMVATANLFQKKNPEVEIKWDKRPLQAFADRPIEEMAFDYDTYFCLIYFLFMVCITYLRTYKPGPKLDDRSNNSFIILCNYY